MSHFRTKSLNFNEIDALERCDTFTMWFSIPSGTASYGIPVALFADLSLPHLCFCGSYQSYITVICLLVSLLQTGTLVNFLFYFESLA